MDRTITRRSLLVSVLLVAGVIAVYWPAVNCGFTNFDDDNYVCENPRVSSGLSWANVLWAFQTFHASNWHPLTWLSHMLDVTIFGLNPIGHHGVNVVLHAVNSILIFLVFRELTGAFWRSALLAAVFALHPSHVESVAWVAERKDVLSTLFFVLCIWAYARYARLPQRGWYYVTSLLLFALGLMAKPMLVTLPCVLLLLDLWPLGRLRFELIKSNIKPLLALMLEKTPFFLLAAGSSVMTYLAQSQGGAVMGLDLLPVSQRLPNAVVAYVRYGLESLWPHPLAVFYPLPDERPLWQILGSGALLILGTIFVLSQTRRRPYFFTGWFWFLGTLVPVIGVVQVGMQAIADRYLYIPLIGLGVMAIWGCAELAANSQARRWTAEIGAGLVLVIYLCLSMAQVPYWTNSVTLFEHAIHVTGDNHVAQHNLGLAAAREHRFKEAIAHFSEAIRLRPDMARVHNNLGFALFRMDRLDEAIAQYTEALRLSPNLAQAHFNLANALNKQGQRQQALEHYLAAVTSKPDFTEAHYDFATALSDAGRLDEAATQYIEALRTKPDFAQAENNLGVVLLKQGKLKEGAGHCAAAFKIDPHYAEAAYNLGTAELGLDNLDAAAKAFSQAAESNPKLAAPHLGLGQVMRRRGKSEEAVAEFREAVRLEPGNLEARENLGALLATQGQANDACIQFRAALEISPEQPSLRCQLAEVLSSSGNFKEAIEQYRLALSTAPTHAGALNNLAWILAANPDPALRDGAEAVRLAELACQTTHFQEAVLVGTLGAAYAEAGRFDDAVKAAERAKSLAQSAGQSEVAERNQQLLELYRSGKPYREPSIKTNSGHPQ